MGKAQHEHTGACTHSDSDDESSCEDVDIAQQVIERIKEQPTLQDKVQLIALNTYLGEKKKLDDELDSTLHKVDLSFRKLLAPFLEQINQIVEGRRALTVDDFKGLEHLITQSEVTADPSLLQAKPNEGFWLKCLKNAESVGSELKEVDEPILKHLTRIEGEKNQDDSLLTLRFYFSDNEYFTNKVLTKEFYTKGDQILKSAGDAIDWKEGKNVTIKITKKKQKNKKTGQKKMVERQQKQESFFNFFNPVDLSEENDDKDEQEDAELDQKIGEVELQHEMAQNIYEDVIPHQLEYFLGVGGLSELKGLDFEDMEEDQEEEADAKPLKNKRKDSSDGDSKSKSKSKGKNKKPKAGKGGAPECKQQ